MSLPAAALRKMLEAGLSLEQAVDIAEAWEQGVATSRDMGDTASKKRARDAARMREKRANEQSVAATSRDVVGDVAPSCTRVVPSFSSSLRSEEVGGGGGGGTREPADDWPSGKASDHLRLIVAAVDSPRLDPCKSPGLVTTAGRLAAWKRDGASWEHDVLPVVAALCGKQRSPVSTWKFFDQAIARSMADNAAALEIPAAGAVRATGPPSLIDRITAERAEARRIALDG